MRLMARRARASHDRLRVRGSRAFAGAVANAVCPGNICSVAIGDTGYVPLEFTDPGNPGADSDTHADADANTNRVCNAVANTDRDRNATE